MSKADLRRYAKQRFVAFCQPPSVSTSQVPSAPRDEWAAPTVTRRSLTFIEGVRLHRYTVCSCKLQSPWWQAQTDQAVRRKPAGTESQVEPTPGHYPFG